MKLLKRVYNWRPSKPSYRAFHISVPVVEGTVFPQCIDLRPTFSLPYDQGQLGSCVSNGVAALVEHKMIVDKYKGLFRPSRLFIYYNCRVVENSIYYDAGATVSDGIASINKLGVCPEDVPGTNDTQSYIWTYSDQSNDTVPFLVPAKFKKKPPKACYINALLHKSLQDHTVSLDRNTVLTVLSQGRPFAFGFVVKSSFEDKDVMSTGIMKVPTPDEQTLGGHCVVACGYKLSTPMGSQGISEWVLIRNSWGTGIYGDLKGHFWMPLNEILCNPNMSSDAHTIDLLNES